jgi:hypothetical protein
MTMKQPKTRGRPRKPISEEERERWRVAAAKYRASPKGSKTQAAYHANPEVKAYRIQYARMWREQRGEEQKKIDRDRQNQRYATDQEFRRRRSDYQRLTKTGMTPEMVDKAIKSQENRCGVCHREFSEELRYYSDHCHDSMKPRGLLCSSCNWAEGQIKATGLTPLEFGQRLHEYLITHG